MRMFSQKWICIFIKWCSIKTSKAMLILREVSWHPVNQDTDALFMHVIYKVHEILRCAITRCRRIITSYLISPGRIIWMFHNWQKFHIVITHGLHIICKLYSDFLIVQEFSTIFWSFPGTQMNFVYIHWICVNFL